MDYTVCEILQVGILEWVAIPFPRVSSQSRDQMYGVILFYYQRNSIRDPTVLNMKVTTAFCVCEVNQFDSK